MFPVSNFGLLFSFFQGPIMIEVDPTQDPVDPVLDPEDPALDPVLDQILPYP